MNTLRLPDASYKGFDELVWVGGSLKQGYKKVSHEYPNKDRGYIENLGLSILQGSVVFDVYNSQDNDTIIQFENILRSKGAGTLVLPTQGAFEDIEMMSWQSKSDDKNLGVIQYTIEFAQTSPNQYPTTTNTNISFFDRLKDKILGDNVDAFDNAWNTIKNKRTQTQKALAKIQKTGKDMINLAKKVEGAGSLLSEFSNTIAVVINSASRLANSPRELATQLKIGFDSLESNIPNARVLYNVVGSYFGFSSGDANAVGNGGIQAEIRQNQQAINNLIRTNALAIGYVAATLIDYKTSNELNEFRQTLKNEYDNLLEQIPDEILQSLEELQVNANRFFDRQVLTLPSLQTINVNTQPLGVLVYSFYGNLDEYDNIYNINNIRDARQVSGNVTIVN
jgi:prophage DNA circulation protein